MPHLGLYEDTKSANQNRGGAIHYGRVSNKTILFLSRRIDWRLLPMLCIVLGLSLIDRTNISSAYVIGMGDDLQMKKSAHYPTFSPAVRRTRHTDCLHLTCPIGILGSRYSIALLVFFITYGIFEVPSNLIIRRIGARVWLAFLITAWGLSVLGMGFARHWTAIVACRVLLGLFEAGCKHSSPIPLVKP